MLRKKQNRTSSEFCLISPLLLLILTTLAVVCGCTRSSGKKSSVRDLSGTAPNGQLPLKAMTIKYSFIFEGNSGQKYPVYMNADFKVEDSQQQAIWNSRIDSDGGLVTAAGETKTIKPDSNLSLKFSRSDSSEGQALYVFSAGNPELGRGMSLKVQKVSTSGGTAWKAISLNYFGSEARIEDSHSEEVLFAPATRSQ